MSTLIMISCLYNYADDNTLYTSHYYPESLQFKLEQKSSEYIDSSLTIKMLAYPENVQVIVFCPSRRDYSCNINVGI